MFKQNVWVANKEHCGMLWFFLEWSISASLLAWFRSRGIDLSGRRHRVVIDNESSDFLPVTSGFPQGSILEPLLFLLFINDMPHSISKETSLPLFADDSKCFR